MCRYATMTCLVLLCAARVLSAHDANPFPLDHVEFSVSASRVVNTDRVVAVVYKEHQAQTQARAADEVNRAVRFGLEQAKEAGLEAHTTVYRTYPIYQKQHLAGWRVIQSFQIETNDSAALASLLGKLQSRLSIQSLEHVLSDAAREAAVNDLVAQAVAKFQARADLVAKSFGRSRHRLVSIRILGDEAGPPARPMAVSRAAGVTQQMESPVIEGGEQRVSVTVSGTVVLEAPQ